MGARPLPRPDRDSHAFWTGGAEGELRIMRCRACRAFIHPPRPVCRICLSDDVAPEAVSGAGRIDTFTVNHQKWLPDMEVPVVIARVALDDAPGVYITTNIVNCAWEEVDVDDRVRVTFEPHGEIHVPLFEKVR